MVTDSALGAQAGEGEVSPRCGGRGVGRDRGGRGGRWVGSGTRGGIRLETLKTLTLRDPSYLSIQRIGQ